MEQSNMMGKRVIVSKRLDRNYYGSNRKWQAVEIQPNQGWIVGFRTIYDGYVDYETGEYGERLGGNYFVRQGHQECALVCFSPRQKAVNVPMDGFELVES